MRPNAPNELLLPDLFHNCLKNMLNQCHELYWLTDLIDWNCFDAKFGALYCLPDQGHTVAGWPAIPQTPVQSI